jgi:hypothetical protein
MRRAARVDLVQSTIVEALQRVGATVEVLSYGSKPGRPDLLVGFRGQTFLIECKTGKTGKLSTGQVNWHSWWRGHPVIVVWTAADALRAIGL